MYRSLFFISLVCLHESSVTNDASVSCCRLLFAVWTLVTTVDCLIAVWRSHHSSLFCSFVRSFILLLFAILPLLSVCMCACNCQRSPRHICSVDLRLCCCSFLNPKQCCHLTVSHFLRFHFNESKERVLDRKNPNVRKAET